jgi:MtN3 and saliva related transmembrane protein
MEISLAMELLWQMVGSVGALLTMFGFVPQILKIHRTKSVEDVSLPMLIQFAVGVFLWAAYGLHREDPIIVISNLVSFASLFMAIVLYFRYS